jgi:dihydrofolate synthase/folylpolyglutamate synthase
MSQPLPAAPRADPAGYDLTGYDLTGDRPAVDRPGADCAAADRMAVDYLSARLPRSGGGPPRPRTLARMRRLVGALGSPQARFPVIHVTGTNGKGSTVAMIAALLGQQGLRVGTYTSPHLVSVTERVVLAGRPVAAGTFAAAVRRVAAAAAAAEVDPTWFEVVTAAGLQVLADAELDVAVIEVGALGRYDATNVVDGAVSVVTNVELDHTDRAGPSRRDVGAEKAGIIRPGRPLVLGEPDPGLAPVFAAERPGQVLLVGRDLGWRRRRRSGSGWLVDLGTPWGRRADVWLGLAGQHQCANAAVALAAADAFLGRPTGRDAVDRALGRVFLPGRFEVVGRAPTVVLDGAHNPAAAGALGRTIDEELAGSGPRALVLGMQGERSPVELAAGLGLHRFDHVVATEPPSPRAWPAADLAAAIGSERLVPAVVADPVAAVRLAGRLVGAGGAVVVTGSLYLIGALRPVPAPNAWTRHAG